VNGSVSGSVAKHMLQVGIDVLYNNWILSSAEQVGDTSYAQSEASPQRSPRRSFCKAT
jgi:hypothetical protein